MFHLIVVTPVVFGGIRVYVKHEEGVVGFCPDNTHYCYIENSECIDAVCYCLQTHYKVNDELCISKKANGADCTHTYQCNDTQAECVDHVCTCKAGLFEDTNNANTCTEKFALGSTCSKENLNQCADVNAECRGNIFDTNKCLCKTTHYKVGNECVPRLSENKVCEEGGHEHQCVEKTVCKKVDGINKCQYKNENTLGSSCTTSSTNDVFIDQCAVPDAECRDDIDGTIKCLCKTTHYQTSNDVCIPKTSTEKEFTVTTEYSDPNTNCIENLCQCKPGFFKDTDTNICHAKIGLETSCQPESIDQCADNNAECDNDMSGVFKCVCKTTHYNSNSECLPRKAENDDCEIGGHELQCVDNASCQIVKNVYKCMCDEGVNFNGECNGVNEMLPSLLCMLLNLLVMLHCIGM
ncbi:protein NEL-like [Mytilus californianus]|uniref:protein NEL-like n=1 Tax=Mytilus californianus TaxID=6549 RepID=UPI00224646CE|nr:protein NEL-like [Mytilus californianus]